MKIHFLGTAAAEGWPAVFCTCDYCQSARTLGGKNIRTRQQLLIDDTLLIDLGPDTYHHALTQGLELYRVEACLITHPHQDHYYPAELGMHYPPFAHGAHTLTLYGSQRTLDVCQEVLKDPAARGVQLQEVKPFEPFDAGDAHIVPLNALHARDRLCMFYLIEKGGKVFLQGYDTGWYPEETWAALAAYAKAGGRLDAVAMDCTSGVLREGTNHSGLPDNIEIRAKLQELGLAKPDTRWILTHFSHNSGLLHDELAQAAGAEGFEVAYDGWLVEI